MATLAHPDRDAAVLDRIRSIVLERLAGHAARVYLFGSWATGTRHRSSDIDIAIESPAPLPAGVLSGLREALEESAIPYRVDVVDLADAGPAFRERVRREGIAWTVSASA